MIVPKFVLMKAMVNESYVLNSKTCFLVTEVIWMCGNFSDVIANKTAHAERGLADQE